MSVIQPFDDSGITRSADGIARYQDRPPSLVEMLRRTVEAAPQSEAIVEVSGERINYRDLWDRAARVAGGVPGLGVENGGLRAGLLGGGVHGGGGGFGLVFVWGVGGSGGTR